MSSPASVHGDDPLRLFLGLRLPEWAVARLAEWQERELRARVGAAPRGAQRVRLVPPANLHVTLAFLGSRPRSELDGIVGALRDSVAASSARGKAPIELDVLRYRETRSVGMLVLADGGGRAASLAGELHERLEALGVYRRERRPWLPHVTVLRCREPPRLSPPLPELGTLVPSDAAAFLSRLHPAGARYEILESIGLDR